MRTKLETATHQSKNLQSKQFIKTFTHNETDEKITELNTSKNSFLFNEKFLNVRNLLENKQEFFLPPSLNPRTYGNF